MSKSLNLMGLFFAALLASTSAHAQVIPTLKETLLRASQQLDQYDLTIAKPEARFGAKLLVIERLKNQIFELVPTLRNASLEDKNMVADVQNYLQIIQSDVKKENSLKLSECADLNKEFSRERESLNGQNSWELDQVIRLSEKLCGKN